MWLHPESDWASSSCAGGLASEWDVRKALLVAMTTGGTRVLCTGAPQPLERSRDDVLCTQPEALRKIRLVSPEVGLKDSGSLGPAANRQR